MVSRLSKIRPSTFSWSSIDSIAPWLLFLGVTWLSWQLASVFWLLVNPPTAPQVRSVMLGGGTASNVPNIIGFKIFAEHGSASSSSSQPDVPMKLEGVFVAQPASLSAAVINVNNTSSRYRVGQKIDGTNYQLSAVDWNQVSLQRNDGSIQTLKFGDSNVSISNASVAPNPAITPQNPNQHAQEALGDAISQLKSNPNAYLGRIGLAMAGGKGYEVTNSLPVEVRNQMGLRAGDKIVSVNGQPVGNPASDAQLLQQVQQSHSAQIQIQRGSQTLTVQQSF
jgi:general secretion pathway protein C